MTAVAVPDDFALLRNAPPDIRRSLLKILRGDDADDGVGAPVDLRIKEIAVNSKAHALVLLEALEEADKLRALSKLHAALLGYSAAAERAATARPRPLPSPFSADLFNTLKCIKDDFIAIAEDRPSPLAAAFHEDHLARMLRALINAASVFNQTVFGTKPNPPAHESDDDLPDLTRVSDSSPDEDEGAHDDDDDAAKPQRHAAEQDATCVFSFTCRHELDADMHL
ncbi:hypothetical protein AURDEDRAFT_167414 [Auricularia subglabra TFB-10046 SS5]|nr:hypothetical protein AURDEDRAFT_167414 [Auricularia subglabra TFB-10046 SS5]